MFYRLVAEAEANSKEYNAMALFERVVEIYNATPHGSTNSAPIQLLRPILNSPSKEATTAADVAKDQRLQLAAIYAVAEKKLHKAAKKADNVHNRYHAAQLRVFNLGDKVLYKIPKQLRQPGQLLYDSDATITKVIGNGRYELEFTSNPPPNADRVFYATEIKKLLTANEKTADEDLQPVEDYDSNGKQFLA